MPIDYGHPFDVFTGLKGEFYDAGHMLGSASVALDVTENGQRRRMVFSGDIGRPDMPILRSPPPFITGNLEFPCCKGFLKFVFIQLWLE